MAMKDYSRSSGPTPWPEAESTPGATYKDIAADLGINRATLREWVLRDRGRRGVGPAGSRSRTGRHGRDIAPGRAPMIHSVVFGSWKPGWPSLKPSERKLATEAADPPQGRQVFRRRDELVSRFQFVHDHRDTYEVKRLCQVLELNRSSYYKWLAGADARTARQRPGPGPRRGDPPASTSAQAAPTARPGLTAELRESGRRVNHKRVARVMRTHSIAGIRPRPPARHHHRWTRPRPGPRPASAGLHRRRTTPGRHWGDITYLPLADGEF